MDKSIKQIAHDMRSPLAVLKGYLASQAPVEQNDTKEFHEAAVHSVNKLLEIVEKLEKTTFC
ncbi:MAG: histidine kinase dimerization/phospho-acceptor domain-containing protein [Pseudomonadota bacterium]